MSEECHHCCGEETVVCFPLLVFLCGVFLLSLLNGLYIGSGAWSGRQSVFFSQKDHWVAHIDLMVRVLCHLKTLNLALGSVTVTVLGLPCGGTEGVLFVMDKDGVCVTVNQAHSFLPFLGSGLDCISTCFCS